MGSISGPAKTAAGRRLTNTFEHLDIQRLLPQENEKRARERAFAGYTVDETIMGCAKPEAVFMHCLPAYRGLEVAADVIDGPQSVVWDEAENRLHAQKALMELLLVSAH